MSGVRVSSSPKRGGIAQLVEHYAGSVRVRSSSLLASTRLDRQQGKQAGQGALARLSAERLLWENGAKLVPHPFKEEASRRLSCVRHRLHLHIAAEQLIQSDSERDAFIVGHADQFRSR